MNVVCIIRDNTRYAFLFDDDAQTISALYRVLVEMAMDAELCFGTDDAAAVWRRAIENEAARQG